MTVVHWLQFAAGARNGNDWTYLLWSGIVADLTMLGAVAAWWHKHVCQEDGCRRLGHHITVEADGHQFRRCRRHHQTRHNP